MEQNSYERQDIVELSEREQCRLKLPIFFGDRSNYTHSVREVLANSRDEILNNFEDGKINVKLYDDNETIEILDTGRGINLQGETNGVKNYYLLLEKLWAGGNHNNLELGIASTGTNSVGLTCTNYCAELFEATSYKNNNFFKASYINGGTLTGIDEGTSEIEHGTRVKFKQDKEVYTSTVFDSNEIKSLCNKLASTTPKITYTYEHNGEIEDFRYDSQTDYLENNAKNNITKFYQMSNKHYETKVVVDGKNYIEKDDIVANISLSTEPLVETYLNGTYLVEGGSIVDGIVDGIKKFLQKDIKDKKVKLTPQDILMSFNIHCLYTSTNPSFSGQTKFSSASPLYKKLSSQYIQSELEILKNENQKEYQQFISHVSKINGLNVKSEDSIKKLKEKLTSKSSTFIDRVENFSDCRVHGEEAELFITEGLSGKSAVVSARNAENQAVLPAKGKFLSTLKANVEQIANNQVIMNLVKVLGCGCNLKDKKGKQIMNFNMDDLKYGKIILAVDRDPDGGSISSLALTAIYVLMPELLVQGKVYLAKTPLYELTEAKTKKRIYAYSDLEKEEIIKNKNIVKIRRNKGLGEVNSDVLEETMTNPKTRVIEKITIDDYERMEKYFNKWMGSDPTERADYISKNLYKFATDLD